MHNAHVSDDTNVMQRAKSTKQNTYIHTVALIAESAPMEIS